MRRYRTQNNATQVGEVFQYCEPVILSNSTIAVSYQHWVTIIISTVLLYCTSHPRPLSARSRVHLRPEKEPIAVRPSPHTSTNTKHTQNIHRVQIRVHKTDMIVITHESRTRSHLRSTSPLDPSPRNKKSNLPNHSPCSLLSNKP
jgi:hypothetical protein